MPDLYDRLENRPATARESALLRDLSHVISVSKSRVPALRAQLKGMDVGKLLTRSDLSRIPIRRHADLLASQAEQGAFGGYAATRLAALTQVFVGLDGLASMAGPAKDWWGTARALYAAGLRKGMLVLNTFAYDLDPLGHMVESGARAIGCPVIPAGSASLERIAAAAMHFAPRFFCGHTERLKAILDCCPPVGNQSTSIKHALVMDGCKPGLRSELKMRGIEVRQAAALPEVGVIAFESGPPEGMMLAEGLLLEIVDPRTGETVTEGAEGEIVLSRINLDYPLLRFGTDLISSVLSQPSTCGRTNTRIKTPRPRLDPTINALHVSEMRRRYPELKMRLEVSRPGGTPHLQVEATGDEPHLQERLSEMLKVVTRRSGTVEIVRPGTLRDDENSNSTSASAGE